MSLIRDLDTNTPDRYCSVGFRRPKIFENLRRKIFEFLRRQTQGQDQTNRTMTSRSTGIISVSLFQRKFLLSCVFAVINIIIIGAGTSPTVSYLRLTTTFT